MNNHHLIAVVLSISATAGHAQQMAPTQTPMPDSPAAWQAATIADLKATHDILRDNSPALVVDRDSESFRAWLDSGYASSLKVTDKVSDATGYV